MWMEIIESDESVWIHGKLANLRKYMLGYDEIVYDFGEFLSTHVHPNTKRNEFESLAKNVIADLQKWVDTFTQKPIAGKMGKYSTDSLASLSLLLIEMSYAVCDRNPANWTFFLSRKVAKWVEERILA